MKHRLYSAAKRLIAVEARAASLPHPTLADTITPPDVPDGLADEAGNRPFFVGNASGTQNHIRLPSGAGFAFSLFTPEATLLDDDDEQVVTHFSSPNQDPSDNGTIRATWEHSRDSSRFLGSVVKQSSDST